MGLKLFFEDIPIFTLQDLVGKSLFIRSVRDEDTEVIAAIEHRTGVVYILKVTNISLEN